MSPLPPELTGARGVARAIATETRFVFGIPGGHMMTVFDALRDEQSHVRTVLVREEALGSVMAEAYGRLTAEPTVVMGQGAWVLGNGSIGIMEAHLGSSPVVILVDATEGGAFAHHGSYQSGSGEYGSYDLLGALRAITKRTFYALTPEQAVQMTQLAFKHATTGEPGPVAVVFHSSALAGQIGREGRAPQVRLGASFRSTRAVPAAVDEVAAAAGAIAASRRPVIVAGSGVRLSRASDQLRDYAEQADIPVATTAAGKGVFPEDHALALGVMGTFGHASANIAVGDADLVLAVGTKLGAGDTAQENPALIDGGRQVLVQVDVEPLNVGWTQQVRHAVIGDAGLVLTALGKSEPRPFGAGRERVEAIRARHGYFEDVPSLPGPGIRGRRVAQLLSRLLPPEASVTCDAGENRLFMLHDFQVRSSGSFLQPNAGGGMGYAVPAGLAARLARPSSPVVAVCGDGGFAMTLHGLMTSVEQGLPLVVVVFNNQALGWVLNGQGDQPFASTFHDFDLAAIASAIGCAARTAENEQELRGALEDALESPASTVVVVRTTLDDKFGDIISPLAGRDAESADPGEDH